MKRSTLIFLSVLSVILTSVVGYIYTLGWEENAQKRNLDEVTRVTERSEAGVNKPKSSLPLDFHRSSEDGGYVLYPLGVSEAATSLPFDVSALVFPEEYFDSCLSLSNQVRDIVARKHPFLDTASLHLFGQISFDASSNTPGVTGCPSTLQEGYYLVSNSQSVLFLTHINSSSDQGTSLDIAESSLLNVSNASPGVFEALFRDSKTLPDGSVVPVTAPDLPDSWVTLTFNFSYGSYPSSESLLSSAKTSPLPVNVVIVTEDTNSPDTLPSVFSEFTSKPVGLLLSLSDGSELINTNPRWWLSQTGQSLLPQP